MSEDVDKEAADTRSWLPAPAPETAGELAIARRGVASRLVRVAIATAAMLTSLILLARIQRDLPMPSIGLDPVVTRGLFGEIVLLAVVVVLVSCLVGLGNVGFRARGSATSLAMSIPLVCLGFLDGTPSHYPELTTVLAVALWGVLIGLTEEIYGRGLLVTALGGRNHAGLSIVGSSIAFAYLHLPTYVHSHGWSYALIRSTSSAAFSASGAIVRLRSGNIVGLVAFHAIDDTRSILAGWGTTPNHDAGDDSSYARAIILGCLWSAAYWLMSRRSIRRAVRTT
jgi:membrane protease YdiL (CAAX protease family)